MFGPYRVGLVIPAYNVENQIRSVIEVLPEFIDRVYTVDDGSRDKTVEFIKELGNSQVSLISHDTNHGPGAAVSTGYIAALRDGMDIIVKMDGDGQMPIENIEGLVSPVAEQKADYTKGDRLSNSQLRRGMPRFRLFGNLILTWLTRIASGYWRLSDSQNGFTAISRRALEVVNPNLYPYYGYLNDLLIRLNVHGFRVIDIPMPARYGSEKSSVKLQCYIPKVSFLLFTRFLWRLRQKYVRRHGR